MRSAQLQSHGLRDVQLRHYDRDDYMLENREALGKRTDHLDRLQEGCAGRVVQLPKAGVTNRGRSNRWVDKKGWLPYVGALASQLRQADPCFG
jgi:hypothetical protein